MSKFIKSPKTIDNLFEPVTKKAVGKTIFELNDYETEKQTKSSVGDAFESWFGKKEITVVSLIWKKQVLN